MLYVFFLIFLSYLGFIDIYHRKISNTYWFLAYSFFWLFFLYNLFLKNDFLFIILTCLEVFVLSILFIVLYKTGGSDFKTIYLTLFAETYLSNIDTNLLGGFLFLLKALAIQVIITGMWITLFSIIFYLKKECITETPLLPSILVGYIVLIFIC